jgi:hypothetical protein
MNSIRDQQEWTKCLKFFGDINRNRPTRLGVFEPADGAPTDLWIECGLPLKGVDLDMSEGDRPVIQIYLGSLTHQVPRATRLNWHLTASGDEDGLDVLDSDGRLTVLRFETYGS